MASAAIAGVNLAESGSVTASSQVLSMPVQNLLTPHVEERWRSLGNSAFIVLDLASLKPIDTVLLRGLTVSASATARVRLSSADASGAAGDISDSGLVASGSRYFDADYGAIAYLLDTPASARYVRIDIADPASTYIAAGRLMVTARTAFTYNFGYGWQVQYVDRSTSQVSRGGQDLVWADNSYRTLSISMEWVTATQRYGIVETIDRNNGRRKDVLIIIDTASDNLARDSIFGLITDLTPVVQPAAVFAGDGPLFAKQYSLKERL